MWELKEIVKKYKLKGERSIALSWEGYEDELAWAAVWLFGATQEESLLNAANAFYKRSGITNRKGLGSKIITIIDCR